MLCSGVKEAPCENVTKALGWCNCLLSCPFQKTWKIRFILNSPPSPGTYWNRKLYTFINRFTSNLRENPLFYAAREREPAIKLRRGVTGNTMMFAGPKTLFTNKQYLNMHRHESNCKYDITMFWWWYAGRDFFYWERQECLKPSPHKFIFHLSSSTRSHSKVGKKWKITQIKLICSSRLRM